MGERKGTNKYYPPDFDPQKHRSLAGYTKQHPLRERARKIKQGILIIRFEMPYNIWCDGCKNHIGMGVRYNAEKSKIGMYYSTPIYKFRMKCHLCNNHFEIKTDPANHDYVIISGARRKEQRWDPKENEQIVPEDRETNKKLALDAMYQLQHGVDDKKKLKQAMPALAQIEERQSINKDDYLLNKMARNMFRSEKKSLAVSKAADKSLLDKSSLDIKLVPENETDIKMAGLLKYNSLKSFEETDAEKKQEIASSSIFSSITLPGTSKSVLAAKVHKQKLAKVAGFGLNRSTPQETSSLSQLRVAIKAKKKDTNHTDLTDCTADQQPTTDCTTDHLPTTHSSIDQQPSTDTIATDTKDTCGMAPGPSGKTNMNSDKQATTSNKDSTVTVNDALNSLLSNYDSSDSTDSI